MPNEIKLYGEIGPGGVTCQQVKTLLASADQTQPLVVRIDSGGGSVFDGLSMYEAFASYPGPKKAIIEPTAFSIASYIAMAFDEVEIVGNGYMMVHSPWMSCEGTDEDLAKNAELLGKLKASMVEAYARKTGMSPEDALGLMQAETYMNAEEAKALGFVNSIAKVKARTNLAPVAKMQEMPQKVYAALFSADPSGEKPRNSEGKNMSEGPVAAMLSEIKAAFPKAKAEFIVKCLEKNLPMASVATAAVEEMMAENEQLLARIAAMEEELASAKAAESESVTVTEEEKPEEEPAPAARARGAKPVARAAVPATKTAKARWDEAIRAALPTHGNNHAKAVVAVNRQNPGLREQMLAEVNAR